MLVERGFYVLVCRFVNSVVNYLILYVCSQNYLGFHCKAFMFCCNKVVSCDVVNSFESVHCLLKVLSL